MPDNCSPVAMILAAGKGTRMRPLTNHTPKPLLLVQGKPLLQHHIEKLWLAGVREVVVNTSYLADLIATFIASEEFKTLLTTFSTDNALNDEPPLTVVLSYEGEQPLETAGGIIKALPELITSSNSPFLVINGDAWCDLDYQYLVNRAYALANEPALGELIMVNNPNHNPEGDFVLSQSVQAGDSTQLKNKTEHAENNECSYTFSGLSILKPGLFEGLDEKAGALGPVLRASIDGGHLFGCYYDGYWLDVGTPERLSQLNEYLAGR